jgi:HSP20 family molecular chaperone IbpA
MSTPAAAPQPLSQHNVTIVPEDRRDEFHARLHQRVAERAYQLFEQDGGINGNQEPHWLRAERELLERVSEVRETGSWMTANASLPESDPKDLEVLIQRDRAIVAGVRRAQGEGFAYLLIRWPVSIDPATAAAYVKGQTLTVTAKHDANWPRESTSDSSRVPAAASETRPSQNAGSKPAAAPRSGEKN